MFSFLNPVLEKFFLFGDVPENVETGVYIPLLVILSYVIAVMGSFTGLRFATDIRNAATEQTRQMLHLGGAFAFGAGIWSMHFIGMLAYKTDMAISYDPYLTVLSMLVAVVIAYGVLAIIRSSRLNLLWIFTVALLLGAAICAMHYTGMAAMRMDADLRYAPSLFGLSFLIAVSASLAALLIVFVLGRSREGKKKLLRQGLAAMVMGAAICGMHYTGMEAAVFIPWADCRYDPTQSFHTLAVSVGVISSAVFSVALTLGMHKIDNEGDDAEDAYSGSKVFLQLASLLSIFLMLLAGSYIFLGDSGKHHQDRVINAAGLQRMLMTRYVHGFYQAVFIEEGAAENAQILEDIRRDRQYIDFNYEKFLQGGSLIVSADGRREFLPENFFGDDVSSLLETTRQKWEVLRTFVTEALEKKHADISAVDYVQMEAALSSAVQMQDITIEAMQRFFWEEEQSLFFRQGMVLGAGFLVFVLTLLYARYYIVQPIAESRQALNAHRDNLQNLVQEQTGDIARARDEAEHAYARLKQETKTIKLLERITNAINDSVTVQDAIQVCLNEICSFTGWAAGHAYLADGKQQRLLPSKIWYLRNPEEFRSLRKVTETTVLPSGTGLPGQVYQTKEAVWIKDVMKDSNFPRAGKISDLPAQAGFGFPVLVQKDVVAVLEFFAGKPERPSDDFMSMMASIGTQLGRVIEREKIEKARADAEKANHAKSEFLASMSHELRTPLNSILGLTQILLEDPALPQEDRNMAGTAHKSAKNLLEIVNDILDISKIEAGNIILENNGFDLKNVVASVMETMMPIASGKGITLQNRFMKEDIPYLSGDSLRVSRVLTNLVGNAVKYTDKGGVEVTINSHRLPVSRKKTGEKPQPEIEIYCEVRDTGIGIAKDHQTLIFDKFTQADASISRKYGGTGLGLAITKDLVEMMGGRIGVESTVGSGSVFWVKLPFAIAEKEVADAQTKQRRARRKKNATSRIPVKKARVLVAEDHLLNQDLLKRLLPRMGFGQFDIVENGKQAVEAFAAKPYDLILMDCHMPEQNGYEATDTIRKTLGENGKSVPIVALTADAMKGTREKCLEAGMDDYLSKPIDTEDLQNVLEQWLVFPDKTDLPGKKEEGKESASVIDLNLIKEYAETPEEIREFAEMFIGQSLESLKLLKKNCTAGENALWVELAHKLKGGAGMWGAESLRALCERAQTMAQATVKERKEMYQKIDAEYARVEEALKKTMAEA